MDGFDGPSRQGTPTASTAGCKVAVELRDGGWAQTLQPLSTDVRDDPVFQVVAVRRERLRLDGPRVRFEPLKEILTDGDTVLVDVLTPACRYASVVARCLCCCLT